MCCKTFLAVTCLAVTIAVINGQKPNHVESLRATDQKLDIALAGGDSTVLDQILAVGYVEINAQGDMLDKAKLLEFARGRKVIPTAVVLGPDRKVVEQTFRTQGNTAIVVHQITTRYPHMDYQTTGTPSTQAPEFVDQEMRTRVYSRNGSIWQLMVQQTTAIPKR